MSGNNDIMVHIPETMVDLLTRLKANPESIISAGHSWLSRHPYNRMLIDSGDTISLKKVEELHRIFRSERMLELGAMVNLQKILYIETNFLPPGIREAIVQAVPFPARALATIGGNLCIPEAIPNLYPLLSLWDAKIELKKLGTSRIIPCRQLLGPMGEISLEPGELLSKVRIPLGRWSHQYHEKIEGDHGGPVPTIHFAGLCRLSNTNIEELRLCWFLDNQHILRFDYLDVQLVGLRYPLPKRELQTYLQALEHGVTSPGNELFLPVMPRVIGLAQEFLGHMERFLEPTMNTSVREFDA